jgi:hypothetical protein
MRWKMNEGEKEKQSFARQYFSHTKIALSTWKNFIFQSRLGYILRLGERKGNESIVIKWYHNIFYLIDFNLLLGLNEKKNCTIWHHTKKNPVFILPQKLFITLQSESVLK